MLANEALVRQAELDLEFTELRAPITGRIGDRHVTPGNLVTGGTGGNTTLLATIVSIDPIRFEFTFDEASLLRYERLARNGKDVTGRTTQSAVRLKLIDEPDFAHSGTMDFVDNVIDRATGTIRGRAQFANADGLFTTGMFGRIQIAGSAPYQALLVPDEAIGTEQARKYVLVVGSDNIARQKFVILGDVTRRPARDQERARSRRSGHRQRTDEGAGGEQGQSSGARVPPQAASSPAARRKPRRPLRRPASRRSQRCACPISSSIGRFSPRWSRSSS